MRLPVWLSPEEETGSKSLLAAARSGMWSAPCRALLPQLCPLRRLHNLSRGPSANLRRRPRLRPGARTSRASSKPCWPRGRVRPRTSPGVNSQPHSMATPGASRSAGGPAPARGKPHNDRCGARCEGAAMGAARRRSLAARRGATPRPGAGSGKSGAATSGSASSSFDGEESPATPGLDHGSSPGLDHALRRTSLGAAPGRGGGHARAPLLRVAAGDLSKHESWMSTCPRTRALRKRRSGANTRRRDAATLAGRGSSCRQRCASAPRRLARCRGHRRAAAVCAWEERGVVRVQDPVLFQVPLVQRAEVVETQRQPCARARTLLCRNSKSGWPSAATEARHRGGPSPPRRCLGGATTPPRRRTLSEDRLAEAGQPRCDPSPQEDGRPETEGDTSVDEAPTAVCDAHQTSRLLEDAQGQKGAHEVGDALPGARVSISKPLTTCPGLGKTMRSGTSAVRLTPDLRMSALMRALVPISVSLTRHASHVHNAPGQPRRTSPQSLPTSTRKPRLTSRSSSLRRN